MNLFSKKFVQQKNEGFTLLELLIVISIIAILSVALILTINPAETLKKSRDAQRISDLNTMKTAIGLILTSSSTPYLTAGNTDCLQGGGAAKVYYSYVGSNPTLAVNNGNIGADANYSATAFGATGVARGTAVAAVATDGTGWIPVAFTWLPGGSPVSNLPLDPVNTISNTVAATGTDLVYRYACQSTGTATKPSNVFELDATLESTAYTSTDDKRASDGGDSPVFYEVGTNLKLLPQFGI